MNSAIPSEGNTSNEHGANEPGNITSLASDASEKPKSLLSLIPNTFEGRLEMISSDPASLTREQRRALQLHEKLLLRRNRQVGSLLRAIASLGSHWTPELAQRGRDYWTDSAMLMPGLTVRELKASLDQRLRESMVMTSEKIAWMNPEWRPGHVIGHSD
jgi:hypothetical protein